MTQQTNQREIRFRAWETFPGYSEPSVMHSWEELNKLDTEGLLHLCDILEGKEKHVSLMQFTGLRDKNNKPIYERDIVDCCRYESNDIYRVLIKDIRFLPSEMFGSSVNWIEVVGNQFNNPELLNQ